MDVQDQPVPETPIPAAPAGDESSSLSDHEAQFSPEVEQAGEPEPGAEPEGRDGRGRYKSRGSRATAEDVPRIQALTKQARTAEAERDALKAEKAKRDALTSTAPVSTPSEGAAHSPAARTPVQPPTQPQAIPQQFPSYEQFVAFEGYQDATYEDYVDARADWRFSIRRAAERQQEAAEREHKTISERVTAHQGRLKDAKTKYPDWDTVVPNDLPISRVLHDAILASEHSAEIQYYLGQHRDDLAALVNETLDYSPGAVAAMRRYLDTVITPSTPARNVAASTGSALALVPPPAPRPPNPVRTGTQAPSDAPPGDEDSLAAHEKFYGRRR